MKYLLAVALSMVLLTSVSGVSHAQEPPLICNQSSALTWDMNTEKDMSQYFVYASNDPLDVNIDNTSLILMRVPHDLSATVIDDNGVETIQMSLDSTLAGGPKYFRVSAVDQAGNESGLSKEVSCHYNTKPGTPTGVTIVLKFKK